MSTRTRVLLICSVVAILAGATSLVVGLANGMLLQALPVVVLGVMVPTLYLQSHRSDLRDARDTHG